MPVFLLITPVLQLLAEIAKLKIQEVEHVASALQEAERKFDIERQGLQAAISRVELLVEAEKENVRKAKDEVADRLKDIAALKESILKVEERVSSLRGVIREKEKAIEDLGVLLMKKDGEMEQVRVECQAMIQESADQLEKAHQKVLKSLKAEHVEKAQEMLDEFSQAQAALRERIQTLEAE